MLANYRTVLIIAMHKSHSTIKEPAKADGIPCTTVPSHVQVRRRGWAARCSVMLQRVGQPLSCADTTRDLH